MSISRCEQCDSWISWGDAGGYSDDGSQICKDCMTECPEPSHNENPEILLINKGG